MTHTPHHPDLHSTPSPVAPLPHLWNRNYLRVWVANFMIFFSFMLLTPLLPIYLRETFGATKEVIGIVLSGYTVTALLARLFSGWLVDSFPRKMVLLACYLVFALLFAGYLFAGWNLLLFAVIRTLHGAPFGATTVSNSTVAIDVLHPTRRAEGIGYYGLSNNLATAISPSIGLTIYEATHSFDILFLIALGVALLGFSINATLRLNDRQVATDKKPISLDRFFLLPGWSEAVAMICLSFSYGVVATYLAIYNEEDLHLPGGAGKFFLILCLGLMCSRLVGARSLRRGQILQNATVGVSISVFGYLLFAALPTAVGFYGAAIIVGLGNGHMFPAFQNMFINLAPNSQRGTANSTLLTAWDVGMGFGVVVGGALAEAYGYSAAFWAAFIVNAMGVLFFYAHVRRSYQRHRLR